MPTRRARAKKAKAVKKQVEAEFAKMERALAASNPGVMDLLRVYGGYDAAVRQADAYLSPLKPAPAFSASDKSVG